MITFKCQCGKTYQVEARLAGRQTRCGQCGCEIIVPALDATQPDVTASFDDSDKASDLTQSNVPTPPQYSSSQKHRETSRPGSQQDSTKGGQSSKKPGDGDYGCYQIKVREHARGGMGQISVARDEHLKREVALKELFDSMTSRERVVAAINHQAPDRTPRNFWAEPATWNRLFEYVGHADKERLLCDLGIDIRKLEVGEPPEREIGDGLFQNYWGERYIYRDTSWGPMREDVPGALANAKSFSDLEAFPWPVPSQFDYSGLAAQCRRWNDYALMYGFADIWERPALVRGLENMFVDMCEQPDWVHYLCRTFTDFYKEDYTRAAEAANGRIDLFLLISDLGCQRGPLMSLKMFREFIAPYIREMCDCIHALGAKVLFHSCGSVRPFIPELIELGVDVLDPIQPVAGMSPESLKADFDNRLAFHGGIDMQRLLPFGTPDEVRATSRHYCETLGAGGGYILAPAHLFQPDIPPENILAVYE